MNRRLKRFLSSSEEDDHVSTRDGADLFPWIKPSDLKAENITVVQLCLFHVYYWKFRYRLANRRQRLPQIHCILRSVLCLPRRLTACSAYCPFHRHACADRSAVTGRTAQACRDIDLSRVRTELRGQGREMDLRASRPARSFLSGHLAGVDVEKPRAFRPVDVRSFEVDGIICGDHLHGTAKGEVAPGRLDHLLELPFFRLQCEQNAG